MEDRIGKCYELSYKFAQRNPDWLLVHGTITNNLPPYQTIYHAWCYNKENEIIHDAVYGETFPAIVYNTLFNTKVDYMYTFKETLDMVLKHGHYGYWEEPKNRANQEEFYTKKGNLKKKYKGV